ncbi:uncharacterized protein LOC136081801 [Hydra vulgaris]|uniref:Uncharacterized protein LOC136081801 n=1 Tax=Hydra vulgaris TaxID=6087 RepID=A0ABM4C3D0_HYDVU
MLFDLSKLPNIPLWIMTLVIFVMSTWAVLGAVPWLGLGYIFSNYFIVLLGFWSDRDYPSVKPVQCFLFALCFTILNDILSMAITYESLPRLSVFRFNIAMAIMLLIFKVVACLFIFKELKERVNGTNGLNQSNYETLGSGGNTSHSYGFNGQSQVPPPQYQPPKPLYP